MYPDWGYDTPAPSTGAGWSSRYEAQALYDRLPADIRYQYYRPGTNTGQNNVVAWMCYGDISPKWRVTGSSWVTKYYDPNHANYGTGWVKSPGTVEAKPGDTIDWWHSLFVHDVNKFSKNKINPLIGSAGVSAVPMAARVSNKVGLEADNQNFLLMHAMGPNVAGVIGSAIAAGVMLKYVGTLM